MIRIVHTLLKLAFLLGVIAYISQHNSLVELRVGDYLISVSNLTLTVLVVLFLVVFALLVRGYGFLRQLPARIKRARQDWRRQNGYRALTRGMVAVAAGEKLAARKAAKQAEDLLKEPPLTMLLSAQSAQLDGDELAAKKYFETMLKHDEMAFLGLRGLIMQALNVGDIAEAQNLLAQAEIKFPKQPWVIAQNLQLQERLGNTEKALALIAPAKRLGSISDQEAEAKTITLSIQSIEKYIAEDNLILARKSTEKLWRKVSGAGGNTDQKRLLLSLLWTIALKQDRLKDADDYYAKRWDLGFKERLLHDLDTRLDAEKLEALARYRAQKRLLVGHDDELEVALYLSKSALAQGLIGEAEAYLTAHNDSTEYAYYQQHIAIALAKDDHEQALVWQQRVSAQLT